MGSNLYAAHRQWAVRPPDERFPNLEALREFTKFRKTASLEFHRDLQQIKVSVSPEEAIAINGSSEPAIVSNWAFGQLCSSVGAPARYLRTLPPEIVLECLNHGLNRSDRECKLLIRHVQPEGEVHAERWAAALTGPEYGRIWDADVVDTLSGAIEGSSWHPPLAYGREPGGLYASDRDMFVFMVSDENSVEIGNARLGRGFFCWNSETGSATFGLTTFLYNYVCGNHIVWGAEQIEELRIIHRNRALNRFYSDAIPVMNRFIENRSLEDAIKDSVSRAMERRIGDSPDEILKRLQPQQFTKGEIEKAWAYGTTEGEDVRTAWGLVQGLTAFARNIPHIDKRVNLERRAGALLN